MGRVEALLDLLSELHIGAILVDRDLRLVRSNGVVALPPQGQGAQHCFAVQWCRTSRCSDCLPVLVFQTGEPREGYRERERPGEARRLLRVRAIPVRDQSGAITHVLETFVDVTDLHGPAAAALSGTHLSSSLAAAGHGVFVADPTGRIVGWSPAMTAILGYPVDEVLGRHVRLLGGGLPGGGARVEGELRAKDGRIVPVAVSTTAIRDESGEVCGHQTIVEDLSELSRLRRELQLGERALTEIVRSSADAIFSTDPAGRIVAWNLGARALLGWEAHEARQLGLADLLGEAAAADLTLRARGGTPVRGLRRPLRRRSGGEVVLEMVVTPQEEGRSPGLSVIARDTRERDRLEQQMVRSEKLAAVGSLAAGIAHEIGTPLNVISASTEYVLLDLPPDDARRTELGAILAETERIRRLVADLLGFARGGAHAGGATRPRDAVERVLRLLHVKIERRGVLVTVDEDPATREAQVAAGQDALHQLLLNVLMNSLAAVSDGGRISIRLAPDRIATDVPARPGFCLGVGDDGPGIPAGWRQRVFDPFFTTRADGTGLGLTVCSRIVADHGGSIHVGDSQLGGALVEIVLPVAESAGAPS